MLIKQTSVFIENKPGKMAKIIDILGANDINLNALSIADATDFGILRLITDEPDKAAAVLASEDFVVKTTNVISVNIENKPGGLVKILRIFKDNNIAVDYMYAYVSKDSNAITVIKTDNIDLAVQKLAENGIE